MWATKGMGLRSGFAAPAAPVVAVHDVVRAKVPAMDVDREVSEQIMAVESLMPDLCAAAAAASGGVSLPNAAAIGVGLSFQLATSHLSLVSCRYCLCTI